MQRCRTRVEGQKRGTHNPEGAHKRGAHNPARGGREGFLEVVVFQLNLEGENQISVIKMWRENYTFLLLGDMYKVKVWERETPNSRAWLSGRRRMESGRRPRDVQWH